MLPVRFRPAGRAVRRAAWLGLFLILPPAGAAGARPPGGAVPPVADPAVPVAPPPYRSAFDPAAGGVETGRADWPGANAAVAAEAHPHAARGGSPAAGPGAHGHAHPPASPAAPVPRPPAAPHGHPAPHAPPAPGASGAAR